MGLIKSIGFVGVAAFAMSHMPAGIMGHNDTIAQAPGSCEGPPRSCLSSVDSAESFKTFVLYRLAEVKAELKAEKLRKS